jgi:FMN-dependent NADH-azoreductase
MNILQINSSIYSGDGQSSRIADQIVTRLRAANPGLSLTVRDFAREPVPHLDAERFAAFLSKNPSEKERSVLEFSDKLIAELKRADVIVLGLPMYNFGVPSQLKSWFDHIARAGLTFKYTEKGALGLLTGKKAYVATARGGVYAGTPADTQTPYVRDFLAFIGISDVEFVPAEGLALGAESREKSLAFARASVERLLPAAIAA